MALLTAVTPVQLHLTNDGVSPSHRSQTDRADSLGQRLPHHPRILRAPYRTHCRSAQMRDKMSTAVLGIVIHRHARGLVTGVSNVPLPPPMGLTRACHQTQLEYNITAFVCGDVLV